MKIDSPQNPRFQSWLSLLESKGIKKHQQALVSGPKLTAEILICDALKKNLVCWLTGPKNSAPSNDVPSYLLATALFQQLDALGTRAPLAVVTIPEIPEWQNGEELPNETVLALPISDPANLGALLRSAYAFGVENAILLKECSSPFLPKVTRAAGLANFHLKLWRGPAFTELKSPSSHTPVALHIEGENLNEYQWPKNTLLILGEEGPGVPMSLKAQRVHIPIRESMDSLNVAVAGSIALYSHSLSAQNETV